MDLSEGLNAPALDRALRQLTARLHKSTELSEPRIARQSLLITKVDLLHDHRDLQQPVRKIKYRLTNCLPRASRIMLQQLVARQTPWQRGQSKSISLPLF